MNLIKTHAPLSIELIKQYFQDKEIAFGISYKDSKIKDKVFLTYLSNLDIPSDVSLVGSTDDEIKQLLASFMTAKSVLKSYTLTMMCAQIMFQANGINVAEALDNPLLDETLVNEFITENKETVLSWLTFINSSMVFLLSSFSELNTHMNLKEDFEVIDDPDFVGLNVVNLFQVSGFLEVFFSNGSSTNLYYFEKQFEGYMFKGKSFFEYYNNKSNIFLPLLSGLIDQELPLDPTEILPDISTKE